MMFTQQLALALAMSVTMLAQVDFRFAHPRADFVAGMKLRPVLDSEAGRMAMKELGLPPSMEASVLRLLNEVESIIVASPTTQTTNTKTSTTAAGDPLFLIRGNFTAATTQFLPMMLGLEAKQLNGYTVYMAPLAKGKQKTKSDVPNIAMIDGRTMLAGDMAQVQAALARLADPAMKPANPLFDRALEMEQQRDIWVIGAMPPQGLLRMAKTDNPLASRFAGQVRNFSIGVGLGQLVTLDMRTTMRSEKQATDMAAEVNRMLDDEATTKLPPQMQVLLRGVKTSVEGSRFQLTMDTTMAQLEELGKNSISDVISVRQSPGKLSASRKPAENSNAPVATKPIAAAVAPAAPRMEPKRFIVIYGMPGGPKEVPFQ
jgi:hypothetical protein